MTSLVFLSLLAFSPAVSASANLDPHYCDKHGHCQKYNVGVSFKSPAELIPRQTELLAQMGLSDRIYNGDGTTTFESWVRDHDDQAAAFLSITRALGFLMLNMGGGETIWGIDLIVRVKEFESDRIYVELDRGLLAKWQANGAKFFFYRADGKHETGNMKFKPRLDLGGSVHHGYTKQTYTSSAKTPRIQINYRDSDAEADIDLDGFPPLIWGFIPNPFHLTYKNSDPR